MKWFEFLLLSSKCFRIFFMKISSILEIIMENEVDCVWISHFVIPGIVTFSVWRLLKVTTRPTMDPKMFTVFGWMKDDYDTLFIISAHPLTLISLPVIYIRHQYSTYQRNVTACTVTLTVNNAIDKLINWLMVSYKYISFWHFSEIEPICSCATDASKSLLLQVILRVQDVSAIQMIYSRYSGDLYLWYF